MLGLRTVIYKVGDINQAKAWYSVAFDRKPYFQDTKYIGFNIGGYELGLQPESKKVEARSESVVAYWGVDDIHATYFRLLELGAAEHEKPTNVGGEIMVATVRDPWDNLVGLIYNPNFKLAD